MYFYLIGIDHNSAAIDERERIYLKSEDILRFWQRRNRQGSAVLVTCNRIEIYCAMEYPDDAFSDISGFFRDFPNFAKYAYAVYGQKGVFWHAVMLAAGLESQVKGELQILRQLENWISADNFPAPLRILWDEAVLLSHNLRRQAGFYDESNNIATFIFDDIRKKLPHKEDYEITIIGTGKIAELLAEYRPQGARLNFAAHKNFNKAKQLAHRALGTAWRLDDAPDLIANADAVISATKSPHYVLKKRHFDKTNHKLYVYDLSLPRGVDPAVRGVPRVSLYNLDDLNYIFSERHTCIRSLEQAQGQAD